VDENQELERRFESFKREYIEMLEAKDHYSKIRH